MKKVSSTEFELKKRVAYIKKRVFREAVSRRWSLKKPPWEYPQVLQETTYAGNINKKKHFYRRCLYLNCLRIFSEHTAQKMKFSIKAFFSKCKDLVTFTGEILDRKLHFLCSESCSDPLRQNANWMYIRGSEYVIDVSWTSI